jgi:hypothetical protein
MFEYKASRKRLDSYFAICQLRMLIPLQCLLRLQVALDKSWFRDSSVVPSQNEVCVTVCLAEYTPLHVGSLVNISDCGENQSKIGNFYRKRLSRVHPGRSVIVGNHSKGSESKFN